MRPQHETYLEVGDYQAYFLFDLFFHIGFILKLSNRFFFAQLRFDWSQKCGFANMLVDWSFRFRAFVTKNAKFWFSFVNLFYFRAWFWQQKGNERTISFQMDDWETTFQFKQSKTFHARSQQCDAKALNKNLYRGVKTGSCGSDTGLFLKTRLSLFIQDRYRTGIDAKTKTAAGN